MCLKYFLIILSLMICVSTEKLAIEEMYSNLFTQIESIKNSIDILKERVDILSEKDLEVNKVLENFDVVNKSLNDLNTQMDCKSDFDHEMEMKMESLEFQQAQEISVLKRRHSNLMNELNSVKKSEERLRLSNANLEIKYIEILKNYENTTRFLFDEINTIKTLKQRILHIEESEKRKEIEEYNKKPLFDVRIDKLPELKKDCIIDPQPFDCKAATKCTQKSGYYKISVPDKETKQIMVYCDTQTHGGNWLYIMQRQNGSENFLRPWSDYVNGFGEVETEYWLGLDNLYALTNNNDRQQLYIYMENFKGVSYSALYDNFVVGNASEVYKLKSLGDYTGTHGDKMLYNVGSKFSTFDNDNDNYLNGNCAREYKCGWWFKQCISFALDEQRIMYLMIRKHIN